MSVSATRLERVHVRCEGLDATTARLRLDQLLAASDLRPPALPPAALLCVRRLSDPLPGTLAIGAGEMRPAAEWERAFVAALEQMMRSASRPAFEAVPAGAEAVLFADRAELLACLARDVCDGTAWTRWWWRRLRARARITPSAAADLWLEEPAYAPAALELLATRSAAVQFARTLSAASATQLAARAASAFAAPALQGAIVSEPPRGPGVADQHEADDSANPPWRESVPEAADPSLTPAQRLVLGVLLTLRRAPVLARSQAFASGVVSWRARPAVRGAAEALPRPQPEPDRATPARETTETSPSKSRDPSLPVPVRAAAPDATPRDEPRPPRAAEAAVDKAGRRQDRMVRTAMPDDESVAATAGGLATSADRQPGQSTSTPPADHVHRSRAPATEQVAAVPPPVAPPAPSPPPNLRTTVRPEHRPPLSPPPPPERTELPRPAGPEANAELRRLAVAVDTELGGIFYLLNLALHLELYGDFTQPLEPGIGLDPWDFIALLGVWLLGRRRDDPIWGLLAGLAGRDREPAGHGGHGFRPPRRWRLPPEWLEPVACEGAWRWSAADGTLRIVHPAGFPVTAVPRSTAPPAEQLRAELRRLTGRRPALARAAMGREPKDPLARWVARFGAYARVRLARSLALADPAELADVLLAHRARVLVSPAHVDVRFALAELPLEIRLAGLDRTPGWIPAAGRFVAFEFA